MLKKEKWIDQLFNNNGVGIIIVDKNRNILEVNNYFCKISEYSHKELINQSIDCFHISEKSYLNFIKTNSNQLLDNSSSNLKYLFKTKNSKRIWVRIIGNGTNDDEEILWIVTDITKELKAQKNITKLNNILDSKIKNEVDNLREKDRKLQYQSRLAQMGEMLNMIAHQSKQPLSAITSTVSYLYGKTMIDEFEKTEFLNELEHIEEYSSHLSSTIDDFKNFFKANKEFEMTTLEEIIDSTLKIIDPILLSKNIKIKISYKCNKNIYSLKNEIRQVILNIIKNSEDAFIEQNIQKRVIKINTFERNNHAVMEIIDNAGGIKKDSLNKIFDSYFTTKTIDKGTGLGLCMSKTIIENNCKGKIEAKNSKYGATFTVSIPFKIDN